MSAKKVTAKQSEKATPANGTFLFGKENYMLMIAGVVVIIVGFILMIGKEDIFDFRKLTLAPIVVIIGFIIEIFAIMRRTKS